MKRFFSSRQRVALYLATNGHCARCGVVLEAGWHADHVIPHSKGGPTYIHNGQALCKPCNLKKGASIVQESQEDEIVLRRFQKGFVKAALNQFANGHKVMVANVHPGSGKTLAMLHTVNELYRQGEIDGVAVFVPRINLCQQFELDWKALSALYASPKMGAIEHRGNKPPLFRAFGYVTTYASLATARALHLREFEGRRIALLLDEAQILGTDDEEGGGTKAADIVRELGQLAKYVIVASGTPYRSDGKRLLFATYSTPDNSGASYLEPDIRASYQLGVSEGYLRPFEFQLSDGKAVYEYFDGIQKDMPVSEMKEELYLVLEEESFWKGMVDSAIAKVQELQASVDPRLCGLIGAYNQSHAAKIQAYIKRHHPTIKSLIAISKDGVEAQDNLRTFKKGGYDILITVRMAYVGYDHKPITVIVSLTHFRDEGYLRQFFARGMRVMPDVPLSQQTLWVFAPDDTRMDSFVRLLRSESQAGLKERTKREQEREAGSQQSPLGYVVDVQETGRRNMGMNPEGDIDQQERPIVEGLIQEHRLGSAPPSGVAALLRQAGINIMQTFGVFPAKEPTQIIDHRTTIETELDLRRELHKKCKTVDRRVYRDSWGETMKGCHKFIGKWDVSTYTIEELRAAIKWVKATWPDFFQGGKTSER